jgi:hypothetical protein
MPKRVQKSAKKSSLKGAPSNGRLAPAAGKSAANTLTQPSSKQARVLKMLRSATGATITAMVRETGWQQHSVRGFLADVVRKKLGLGLRSEKVDGQRTYRIATEAKIKSQTANKRSRI